MGFIYKITNTITKKCYIGETTKENPEVRWKQHQYNVSKGIGCPALRNAVIKYGLDKFKFEVLIICFDEDRYIYEKEYIKKYNSVVPNGYNILEGGAGGGFKGKHHTPETIARLAAMHKKRFENLKERQKSSIRAIAQMKKVKESNIDWGAKVKSSEKFILALQEKRVGGLAHNKERVKEVNAKISNSLKEYYKHTKSTLISIDKHRNSMANAVGIPVQQYTKEGIFVKSYKSCAEASRLSGAPSSSIQACIKGTINTGGGFIWKKET
jgi:group I intron endonuclease